MGRRTEINKKANKKIKNKFIRLGTRTCEAKLDGCLGGFMLSFAHRHKRRKYYSCPEMLWNLNQVILACAVCHDKMEKDSKLTEKVFKELRGKDEMSEL